VAICTCAHYWLLVPLLSQATFDFLVCVGLAWGLAGRLAVTGDSMEAGPYTSWPRRNCSVRGLGQ
jgi:hypothetical protein